MKNTLFLARAHVVGISLLFGLCAANALAADTDLDGLDDLVETNTGVFVSPANTGTDPSGADTDGDGARDGWEVGQGSNPLSASSFPEPASARVMVRQFSNIAGSGISPTKSYTHAISGGSAATVNGVAFQELSSTVTPANFSWEAGNTKNQVRPTDGIHLNDWVPANGGISDPELITLLSGFTYATQAWFTPTEPQRYTLDNLSNGQLYELRIYTRVWAKGGTGAPIDITFTNGQEVIQPWGGLPRDRPDYVLGTNNRDSVFFLSYLYRAQTNSLVIDAKVHPSMPRISGSLHLYALTNEVVQDTDGDMLPDSVETNTGNYTSPANTGTSPNDQDSDDDGINDWSEIYTHGTNPTRADSDGDGFDDLFEINTGFDPIASTSTPDTLSSIRTAVEFRFNAANGVSYRIEASTDLNGWGTIETNITGTGGIITRFYSTETIPKRYFRARRN